MNKKGFTLIELLAVIVVLALILIIAVPRILNVIENTEKEAFRMTGEHLVKSAGDRGIIESMNNPASKTYTITDGNFVGDKLPMSGKLPNIGTINVKEDGKTSLTASNDKYCIRKDYEENRVTIDTDIANCKLLTPTDTSCFTYTKTSTEVTITDYEDTCSKDVIIPSEIEGLPVTTIGNYAMSSHALTSIYIPETIKTINTGGFHNNLLESIVIPKGIKRIERDSISYNQLKTIVIPEGVEYLGPFSFENNQLENVVLPSSLKIIDDGAFWYNVIPEITIPNGVEKIGKYAFYINLLNNLNIPPSVNSVGIRSFNNNLLPDSQAFIYARNIDGTKDLTRIVSYGGARRDNIEIPSTVITISENTFYLYETEIESIVIPNGVTTIEKDAFSSSLKNITLPSNVNIQTDSITTNFYNTYVINNASAAGTYTAPFFFGTWTKQ